MNNSRDEPDVAAPFDYDELLGRCIGRADLVAKSLESFVKFLPPQVAKLEQFAAAGDHTQLRALAHQLKGGALTISAHQLGKLAHRLESAADENSSTNIAACLNDLRVEVGRLIAGIGARLKKE